MKDLKITIDNWIRIDAGDAKDAGLSLSDIRSAFSYPNPDFSKQSKLGFWTGDTPRKMSLCQYVDGGILIPRGGWARLKEKLDQAGIVPTVVNQTVRAPLKTPLNYKAPFKLGPDQRSAVKQCVGRRTGIVVGPCSSGKSEIAIKVISEIGQRALVLCHTERILKMWIETANDRFGPKTAGALYGKSKTFDRPITVGMIQTVKNVLNRDPEFAGRFGCVILDECFPAGTLVDGRPIETIKPGDFVSSFDEKTGRIVKRTVTRTFKRKPGSLGSVHVDGREIPATPGHPFLTNRGWRELSQLNCGDLLLRSIDHEEHLPMWKTNGRPRNGEILRGVQIESTTGKADAVRDEVPKLWKEPCPRRIERESGAPREYIRLLLEGLQNPLFEDPLFANHERNEPKTIQDHFRSHASNKPNAMRGNENSGLDDTPRNETCAKNKGREWDRADEGANPPGNCNWVGNGICDPNRVRSWRNKIPDLLQGGHWEQGLEDCDRSRRTLAHGIDSSRTGQEETEVFGWSRVEGVSIHEPTSDGTFGGRCPDGYVYNFEVDGTNTYLVDNGVIVHNCHHAPASTFTEVINSFPAAWRLGFTATVKRRDGKDLLLYDAFGAVTRVNKRGFEVSGPSILFEITDDDLDTYGRIVPVDVVVVPTEFRFDLNREEELTRSGVKRRPIEVWSATVRRWAKETKFFGSLNTYADFLDAMCHDIDRQKLILSYLVPEVRAGNACLLLADRREFCLEMQAWLKRLKIESGRLMGTRYAKEQDKTEAALKDGKILVAVGTSIADEGLNIPVLSRGFGCTPAAANAGRFTQQMGRFKRKSPGKVDAVYYYFLDRRVGPLSGHLRAISNAVRPPHRLWYSTRPGERQELTRAFMDEIGG